jgi:hypothetical protein
VGLLLGLLWAGAAAAQEPRTSRRSVSLDGTFRVQLVEDAPGDCRLRVEGEGGGLRWVVRRCVGAVDDAYWVSRDGDRVWVVHTLPQQGAGRAGRQKVGRRWVAVPGYRDVVVARKLDRKGRVLEVRRLSDVVSPAGYGKVRETRRSFQWLAGVGGVPGRAPRMNAAGQVELETVQGKTVVLPLE